jgi:hypothetical protein
LRHLGLLERVLIGRHLVLLEVPFISTHFIINMEATWQPVQQGLEELVSLFVQSLTANTAVQ